VESFRPCSSHMSSDHKDQPAYRSFSSPRNQNTSESRVSASDWGRGFWNAGHYFEARDLRRVCADEFPRWVQLQLSGHAIPFAAEKREGL
jgi:hypothetical protein